MTVLRSAHPRQLDEAVNRSKKFALEFVANREIESERRFDIGVGHPTGQWRSGKAAGGDHLVRDVLSDKARIQSVHHRTLVREGELVACPRRRRSSHETGGTTCRERGGQYVLVQVGAEPHKKKKKT